MAGRPRKPPAEKRTAQVPPLRVTADELLHIEAAAARFGLTVTDYGRHAMLERPVRVVVERRADHGPTLSELTRIGVNLNQLAKIGNVTGELPHDLAETLDQLRAVMAALDQEAHR